MTIGGTCEQTVYFIWSSVFQTTPHFMVAPGELLTFDYRPSDTNNNSQSSLKIVQWNVERNYGNGACIHLLTLAHMALHSTLESKAIIDTLKELDADVYLLQEIDIGCRRSGSRDHMQELCKALKVKGAFVCEFLEIDSPIRQPRDEVCCIIYFILDGWLIQSYEIGWWCSWQCYIIQA